MASRDPRPSNDTDRNDEESTLLTGERVSRNIDDDSRRGPHFWRQVGLFTWALVATAAVIVLAIVYQHDHSVAKDPHRARHAGKRNMIFMVSDGMGPTSLSMTRSFRQYVDKLPIDNTLTLDKHHIGSSRTRSSSSLVTDSAAGATAFACAKKSYNGAISVLPDHSPCGTVLEAAKAAGYMTGLVVTTRITDATPACFSSHVNIRGYEDLIAEHQLGEYPLGVQVDLLMGGGRCHFLPNSTSGSCRADDKDLIKLAKSKGFHYFDDRKGFDALEEGKAAKLPLLGLVAPTDIPYEIDRRFRNKEFPSLEEMTRTALRTLSDATKNSEHGFFIMIEGSRIDHAGHGNDPAAQVHEVLAYDKAFAAVLEFLEKDSTPGVLVSTSDHETGGLAAARQLHETYPDYLWLPDALANATHSSEYLEPKLNAYLQGQGHDQSQSKKRSYIREELIKPSLGIFDTTDAEIDRLIDNTGNPAAYLFADLISRRAQIGWSTHGHSAADVSIFASSPHDALPLVGNHENTEVGEFIASYLSLDLDAITQKLKGVKTKPSTTSEGSTPDYSWMGKPLNDMVVDELDTYHGDFKRRLRRRGPDELAHEKRSNCGCENH
ncbi:vacuolar alkaline phosphatase [Microsporum canis]|uniref:Alkaline phosphatase n=1 Tax=Arthroderma otae (strain ATCC MYA-4605 / CBS 113480) TaxID=554155 RepID=C5FT81_ARTOC|nr:alkaline phosphatase [Microsporum canis CBS 113480]EEQ33084.1 alkaline phosphatase [Microsporum canis CBS 113480]